jgi:hypothetical protein
MFTDGSSRSFAELEQACGWVWRLQMADSRGDSGLLMAAWSSTRRLSLLKARHGG